MSGSVMQWLNICYPGKCVIQGGRWHMEALSCDSNYGLASINSISTVAGVRCCADAVPKTDHRGRGRGRNRHLDLPPRRVRRRDGPHPLARRLGLLH
jgi:hypothetical protein